MSKLPSLLLLLSGFVVPRNAIAQGSTAALPSAGTLSGRWMVTADFKGTPLYFNLELEQQGDRLTGNFGGDKLEGSVSGATIHFLAKDDHGGTEEGRGTLTGGTVFGTVIFTNGDDPGHPASHPFTATLVPARHTGPPERHEFVPTTFHRRGDCRQERASHPFRPCRPRPRSCDDGIVDRATDSDLAVKNKDGWKTVRWHLDTARGVATPEKPAGHGRPWLGREHGLQRDRRGRNGLPAGEQPRRAVAQVLGTASEYRISEVADRNAGIVLKISKERMMTLAAK